MPRIFISYRRADSQAMTGRIHEHLVKTYGDPNVFRDVSDIPMGVNFKTFLEKEVGSCDVLLAVIGKQWVTIADAEGRQRLADPNDFVRIEVETGLKRPDVRVIPILVDGASMPAAQDLPESLRGLPFQNGAQVRYDPDFDWDMQRLVKQIGTPSRPWPRIALAAALIVVGVLAVFILSRLLNRPGGPIGVGQTVGGEITSEVTQVDYTIALEEGQAITVTLRRIEGSLDPFLLIVDSSANVLESNDDAAVQVSEYPYNAQIAGFVAPATGTYTIRATRLGQESGDTTGRYELQVEEASSDELAQAVTPPPTEITDTPTPQDGTAISDETPVSVTPADDSGEGIPIDLEYAVGARGDFWEVYFTRPGDGDPATMSSGIDARLVEAIDATRRTLDVAAFEFDSPTLTEAILRAHERGVRVRLVVDDEFSGEDTDSTVPQFIEAGISVVGDGGSSFMHDSFMILDGQTVWTGSWGYTVSASYANNNNALALHSRLVVEDYQMEFNEMFTAQQFGSRSPANTPNVRFREGDATVQIYFTPEDSLIPIIVDLVGSAERSVRFMTFSFTADEIGATLAARAEEGILVQGVFESVGGRLEASELERLFCGVIAVRQDGNRDLMHHKVIIIDDHTVLLGSLNLTQNSMTRNDENVVIIQDPALAAQYLAEFQRRWDESIVPTDVSCQ